MCCVFQSHFGQQGFGNSPGKVHATFKKCWIPDEVGRVIPVMRRLQQPDEVVADQPPDGVRCSDESEERTAIDRSAWLQFESVKPAAHTAIENTDPRMEGHEETTDDAVTNAAGQVSAGRGV